MFHCSESSQGSEMLLVGGLYSYNVKVTGLLCIIFRCTCAANKKERF